MQRGCLRGPQQQLIRARLDRRRVGVKHRELLHPAFSGDAMAGLSELLSSVPVVLGSLLLHLFDAGAGDMAGAGAGVDALAPPAPPGVRLE